MQIDVLDKGFVRLDAHLADDLSVVNGARVSLDARSDWITKCGACGQNKATCEHTGWNDYDTRSMSDRDEGLISFLMRERHGTPFEHNYFRFHVKAPIVVFREWHRHRVGHSYNEWSGRYSELKNEFYIPEYVRVQTGKPGAYTFEPIEGDIKITVQDMIAAHSQRAFDQYRVALASGVAKEQARLFLPPNIYSQMIWSCNSRSLMHFLSLRNDKNAMYEIREYAKAAEEIFKTLMPRTARAFDENGRVAP